MFYIFYTILSMMILSFFLVLLTILLSKNTKNLREKWNAFECGFNIFNLSRNPFSMRFFLIAIIFIIFDVEIALIIPFIPTMVKTNLIKWTLTSISFMTILILGILIEWKEQTFNWKM